MTQVDLNAQDVGKIKWGNILVGKITKNITTTKFSQSIGSFIQVKAQK